MKHGVGGTLGTPRRALVLLGLPPAGPLQGAAAPRRSNLHAGPCEILTSLRDDRFCRLVRPIHALIDRWGTGPITVSGDPACLDARLDGDHDVDEADLARFVGCLNGPRVPADPNCP